MDENEAKNVGGFALREKSGIFEFIVVIKVCPGTSGKNSSIIYHQAEGKPAGSGPFWMHSHIHTHTHTIKEHVHVHTQTAMSKDPAQDTTGKSDSGPCFSERNFTCKVGNLHYSNRFLCLAVTMISRCDFQKREDLLVLVQGLETTPLVESDGICFVFLFEFWCPLIFFTGGCRHRSRLVLVLGSRCFH